MPAAPVMQAQPVPRQQPKQPPPDMKGAPQTPGGMTKLVAVHAAEVHNQHMVYRSAPHEQAYDASRAGRREANDARDVAVALEEAERKDKLVQDTAAAAAAAAATSEEAERKEQLEAE